jgi:tripeptidyl-peptidase-1
VALRQRNTEKLEEELLKVSDPASPQYLQHWSHERLGRFIGPDESAVRIVIEYFERRGLSILSKSRFSEYMVVNGSVSAWSELLSTTFEAFQHLHDEDLVIHRAISPIEIPDELKPLVTAFFNTEYNEVALRTPPRELTSNPVVLVSGYVTPSLVKQVYSIPDRACSSNTTIGFYSPAYSYYSSLDQASFRNRYGLGKSVLLDPWRRDNPGQCALNSNFCNGNNLVLQYLSAIAEGCHFVALQDNIGSDLMVDWIRKVSSMDSLPQVIAIGVGIPETAIQLSSNGASLVASFDTEAAKLGLLGVSILATTGDYGSVGGFFADQGLCSDDVVWPASSPFVTAVGSTMGPEVGSHTTPEETCSVVGVVDLGGQFTSGGGVSRMYSQRPQWQRTVVNNYMKTRNTYTADGSRPYSGRSIPDVSAFGNKFLYVTNSILRSGSDGCASVAVVSGMIGVINSRRQSHGNASLGFLNPALYTMGQDSSTLFFRDITVGRNNKVLDNSGILVNCGSRLGWDAAPGWDATTGLGSPIFPSFSSFLQNASSFSLPTQPSTPAGKKAAVAQLTIILLTTLGCFTCVAVSLFLRKRWSTRVMEANNDDEQDLPSAPAEIVVSFAGGAKVPMVKAVTGQQVDANQSFFPGTEARMIELPHMNHPVVVVRARPVST